MARNVFVDTLQKHIEKRIARQMCNSVNENTLPSLKKTGIHFRKMNARFSKTNVRFQKMDVRFRIVNCSLTLFVFILRSIEIISYNGRLPVSQRMAVGVIKGLSQFFQQVGVGVNHFSEGIQCAFYGHAGV